MYLVLVFLHLPNTVPFNVSKTHTVVSRLAYSNLAQCVGPEFHRVVRFLDFSLPELVRHEGLIFERNVDSGVRALACQAVNVILPDWHIALLLYIELVGFLSLLIALFSRRGLKTVILWLLVFFPGVFWVLCRGVGKSRLMKDI
jgi:hypothetical protein